MTDQIVEWYQQFQISPVHQDISDLNKHYARREALYRHLGIHPFTIRGSTVLEVGPGSGFNSLYTASLSPHKYVLLEGNPTGVEDIKKLFGQHAHLKDCIEIAPMLIQDLEPSRTFDIVICEGMLSGVPDPEEVLKLLARHVKPGGLLVTTCIDQISYYSETLRRICAQLLVSPSDSIEEQTKKMLPAFSPHLSKLPGMSRSHEHWIIDSMINPASIGPLLSIERAIASISKDFDFYHSSPHFVRDWRWYKQVYSGNQNRFNELAVEQYWEFVHCFLDHTHLSDKRSPGKNRELFSACETTRALVRRYEKERDPALIPQIASHIKAAAGLTREFCPGAAQAMEECAALITSKKVAAEAIGLSPAFSVFFGRGQQYISFIRHSH